MLKFLRDLFDWLIPPDPPTTAAEALVKELREEENIDGACDRMW